MAWDGVIGGLGALAAVWLALVVTLWLVRPRNVPLRAAVRVLPDIARLGRDLVRDRSVPLSVRLALVGLALWIVSPVDLIPEVIPVVGPLDDVIVAVLVLRHARRRLGLDELRRRWRGTDDGFALLTAVL